MAKRNREQKAQELGILPNQERVSVTATKVKSFSIFTTPIQIKEYKRLETINSNIIKLNEELTAENSRLLEELDGITSDKDIAELNYNKAYQLNRELSRELDIRTGGIAREQKLNSELKSELTSIKSKWWYKLMTWGW